MVLIQVGVLANSPVFTNWCLVGMNLEFGEELRHIRALYALLDIRLHIVRLKSSFWIRLWDLERRSFVLSSWQVKMSKLVKVRSLRLNSFQILLCNFRSESLVFNVLSQTNVLCCDVSSGVFSWVRACTADFCFMILLLFLHSHWVILFLVVEQTCVHTFLSRLNYMNLVIISILGMKFLVRLKLLLSFSKLFFKRNQRINFVF